MDELSIGWAIGIRLFMYASWLGIVLLSAFEAIALMKTIKKGGECIEETVVKFQYSISITICNALLGILFSVGLELI